MPKNPIKKGKKSKRVNTLTNNEETPVGKVQDLIQMFEGGEGNTKHTKYKGKRKPTKYTAQGKTRKIKEKTTQEATSNQKETLSWLKQTDDEKGKLPDVDGDSTSTATTPSLFDTPQTPVPESKDVKGVINQIVWYDQAFISGYLKKLDDEARALLGRDYRNKKEILLNEKQIRGIANYLIAKEEEIKAWFEDNPNSSILRIGKKHEQRGTKFKGGELDRTIEIHRNRDGSFQIYVAISKKLATGQKEPKLARVGAEKKVTRLVLLNPDSLYAETKLLGKVTKRQKVSPQISKELLIEREIYGEEANAPSVGQEYLKGNRQRIIRTSEDSALGDLTILTQSRVRALNLYTSDSRYNPTNPEGSILKIMESLSADILGCMQKIHAKGYVHNDIKPSNILLTRDQNGMLRARVSDFGITERVGEGEPLSTLDFASPQVFQRHLLNKTFNTDYFKCKYPSAGRATFMHMRTQGLLPPIEAGANPKDDMWSVGITLCNLADVHFYNEDSKVIETQLQDPNSHPFIKKHAQLLRGLLAETRESRISTETALRQLHNPPHSDLTKTRRF